MSIGTCEQNSGWSTWDDRDDPSATGDWELLHLRHDARDLCAKPTGAEARIIGNSDLVTSQNVLLTLEGFICQNNNQQSNEGCLDYEVRFCCASTTELEIGTCDKRTSTWSSWNDRDDPSATGDWELLHLRPDAHQLCDLASGVQARVVGSLAMTTPQTVSLTLAGLSCINVQQADMCFDYEVRFCCPFPVGKFIKFIL